MRFRRKLFQKINFEPDVIKSCSCIPAMMG